MHDAGGCSHCVASRWILSWETADKGNRSGDPQTRRLTRFGYHTRFSASQQQKPPQVNLRRFFRQQRAFRNDGKPSRRVATRETGAFQEAKEAGNAETGAGKSVVTRKLEPYRKRRRVVTWKMEPWTRVATLKQEPVPAKNLLR